MKTFYLLRHAQAAAGHPDHKRPLTDKGIKDAKILGDKMRGKNYAPQLILCSDATRTRQTLENLDLGKDAEFTRYIYEGTAKDYLDLLQEQPDEINSILLVGHNPSCHMLAATLANEDNPQCLTKIQMGYKPCTLSMFKCDIESWSDLVLHANKLEDCIFPQA